MITARKQASPLTNRLRHAVGRAVLAPSSHNTQPWKFRIKKDEIELLADRRRSCPIVDPQDRELHISCGAALYLLRLAMKYDRMAAWVRTMPCKSDPDLLARVKVAGPHRTTKEEQLLFDAIEKRRTNRFPFEDRPVDPELQSDFCRDVESEHAWVRFVVTADEKHAVAELISAGDRLQANNKFFRRELSQWVHSNRSARRDGIPGYALGSGDLSSNFASLAIRTFDWGNGQAAKDQQLAEGSPLLAVLGTDNDTPRDWIACGQGLAKMLLRATSWSVDASFLNQPIEVPELRPQVAKHIRVKGYPQVLLRLGYGNEVRPTPRRPLEEVVVSE